MEYIEPKQGSTKTLQKLKCKHCGGTWFERRPIKECEFVVNPDLKKGDILLAVTEGNSIYYRCIVCSKLNRIIPSSF